jgi:pSer/pThr/pTyr-binding forkhead associated (FHA) protein
LRAERVESGSHVFFLRVSDAEVEVGADWSSYAQRGLHQERKAPDDIRVYFYRTPRPESVKFPLNATGDMPYIVLAEKDREIDRRELTGPLTIGRSPECDVSVRDILLSRRHCAIEPFGSYWVIADLGSKNGTWLRGHAITRHVLAEGEVLRIGKIQLCFRAGAYIPAPPSEAKPTGARAADPKEALAGTVAGFRFEENPKDLDQEVVQKFPRPKPRPVAPKSYASDQVYVMLADIASSSWDSALMDSSRRKSIAELPKPILKEIPAAPVIVGESVSSAKTQAASEVAPASTISHAPGARKANYVQIFFYALAWLWAILIVAGWLAYLPW